MGYTMASYGIHGGFWDIPRNPLTQELPEAPRLTTVPWLRTAGLHDELKM